MAALTCHRDDYAIMPSRSATSDVGWSIGLDAAENLGETLQQFDVELGGDAAEAVRKHIDLSVDEIAALLDISPRTMSRRLKGGRLTPLESDRLYRFARLFEQALDIFGSDEKARLWLKKEQVALGGRVPLQVARYEPGVQEVRNVLGRIAHGVPL